MRERYLIGLAPFVISDLFVSTKPLSALLASIGRIAFVLIAVAAVHAVIPAQTRASAAKSKVEPLISQAVEAVGRMDWEAAKTVLKTVFRLSPNNVAAYSIMGIIAERENDLMAAERYFASAARYAPRSSETRNNYGAILLRLDRKERAAQEFAASLKINPNQLSSLVNLAQIRFAENDLKTARELFEKAKTIQPDVQIMRALVVVSLRLNERDRAFRDFQEYAAYAKNSDLKAASRIELGKALLENGLADEAVQELETAIALEPSNVEALTQLSRAYLAKNEIKAAGRLLESAVARGIHDAKIYAALADVYKAGGFVENAIPAMRLAIEKDPKSEFYRARYGLLLIDTRAPAAAIIRLEEALKEFPNSARLWLALGIAQQSDGKVVEARGSFDRALKIEPKSIPALAYLATSQVEQAQYAEAVETYRRALAIEANNAVLHYLIADTMLKIPSSDPAEIQKHLERAVKLDVKIAQAHFALGKLHARGEKWPLALAEFEQTVKYAPELAEAYYQLGRTLARLKRTEESKAAFDTHKKLSESQTAQKENHRQDLLRRLADVRF